MLVLVFTGVLGYISIPPSPGKLCTCSASSALALKHGEHEYGLWALNPLVIYSWKGHLGFNAFFPVPHRTICYMIRQLTPWWHGLSWVSHVKPSQLEAHRKNAFARLGDYIEYQQNSSSLSLRNRCTDVDTLRFNFLLMHNLNCSFASGPVKVNLYLQILMKETKCVCPSLKCSWLFFYSSLAVEILMKQDILVIMLHITAVSYLNRHYIYYCSVTLFNATVIFHQKWENMYIMSSRKTSRLIIALCSLMWITSWLIYNCN